MIRKSILTVFLLSTLIASGCGGSSGDKIPTGTSSQSTQNPYNNGYILASTKTTYSDNTEGNNEVQESKSLQTYDPTAGTTTVDYYRTEVSNAYARHVHTYNVNGLLVEKEIFRRDIGSIINPFSTTIYSYNEGGYLTNSRIFYNEPSSLTNETQYLYDENGALMKAEVYDGSGAEAYQTSFYYDADGSLNYSEKSSNDNRYLQTDYTSDSSGRVTKLEDFDNTGTMNASLSFVYDENGNLTELVSIETNSTLVKKFEYKPTTIVIENPSIRLQELFFINLELN